MNPEKEHFKNTMIGFAAPTRDGGASATRRLTAKVDRANLPSRHAGRRSPGPRTVSAPMTTEPKDAPEPEAEAPHVAKVGVIDAGHNVTSFNDEPINGLLADIADGDA